MTDPDWMSHAACRGQTHHMFPEQGHKADRARQICNTCTVGHQCEAWAHLHCVTHGIWNGKTVRQLSNERNRPAA
jgi:hypothetical protein